MFWASLGLDLPGLGWGVVPPAKTGSYWRNHLSIKLGPETFSDLPVTKLGPQKKFWASLPWLRSTRPDWVGVGSTVGPPPKTGSGPPAPACLDACSSRLDMTNQ